MNSLPLGSNRKDTVGVNRGLYELASGPEISGYFDAVMRHRLLPSRRVSGHHLPDGVDLVPPNALPQLEMKPAAPRAKRFVTVGAGKTAMEVGVWLLK